MPLSCTLTLMFYRRYRSPRCSKNKGMGQIFFSSRAKICGLGPTVHALKSYSLYYELAQEICVFNIYLA